jgi:hypothetical protein
MDGVDLVELRAGGRFECAVDRGAGVVDEDVERTDGQLSAGASVKAPEDTMSIVARQLQPPSSHSRWTDEWGPVKRARRTIAFVPALGRPRALASATPR